MDRDLHEALLILRAHFLVRLATQLGLQANATIVQQQVREMTDREILTSLEQENFRRHTGIWGFFRRLNPFNWHGKHLSAHR